MTERNQNKYYDIMLPVQHFAFTAQKYLLWGTQEEVQVASFEHLSDFSAE